MQKFNKYSRNLIITTALYILIQILYSWRMDGSGKAQLYAFFSALIIAGNVFFIIRMNNKPTDQLMKVFNSYLLISTFGFYLTYCLKATLITPDIHELATPLPLELILLATLIFNGWQIFIYSREIKAADKKNAGKKKTLFNEIFSWVDALLSAVIFVLLINIFLIQIYSIPSESMFPVFFVKDRPVVDKITRGPSLPFTHLRIPPLQKINRGDIVTLRNPKYEKTADSELKHLLSQFLYMITFTTVNLDKYDQYGHEKADPLVKRVVGLPGEQLQIINDVIYSRTDLNQPFKVLDNKDIHSQINLYKLPQSSLNRLRYLPIDKATRDLLNLWDKEIVNLDRNKANAQILADKEAADKIRAVLLEKYDQALKNELKGKYDRLEKGDTSEDLSYKPFQKIEKFNGDVVDTFYNLENSGKWDSGWAFLTTDTKEKSGEFFRVAAMTNLRYKMVVSDFLVNYLAYLESTFSGNTQNDSVDGLKKAEAAMGDFQTYFHFYDFRNLPPFPENGVIPKKNYFLMGDNRYNSLDLRHGLKPADRHLVGDDPNSLISKSYLKPMTINEKWIEGFVIFRLFPLNRIGIP